MLRYSALCLACVGCYLGWRWLRHHAKTRPAFLAAVALYFEKYTKPKLEENERWRNQSVQDGQSSRRATHGR